VKKLSFGVLALLIGVQALGWRMQLPWNGPLEFTSFRPVLVVVYVSWLVLLWRLIGRTSLPFLKVLMIMCTWVIAPLLMYVHTEYISAITQLHACRSGLGSYTISAEFQAVVAGSYMVIGIFVCVLFRVLEGACVSPPAQNNGSTHGPEVLQFGKRIFIEEIPAKGRLRRP
jgi:hypothetical protein